MLRTGHREDEVVASFERLKLTVCSFGVILACVCSLIGSMALSQDSDRLGPIRVLSCRFENKRERYEGKREV